ncbi:hypothetical protein Bca52824_015373 [Brassica carinata]|uniref:FKB95-like N-terminal Kelch domain-containing protein n=1 Tax=Brassica carinata TaxID=52824 RepID=A0A8X7W4B7_BRACI|nr:hypothetical protein Bca52824_015373 [Brassica carinata]
MSFNIRAENKQLPSITSLPEDIVVDILARNNKENRHSRLYILRQKEKDKGLRPKKIKKKDKGLVLIPGLPAMPRYGSFAAVGSRIYVFDGIKSYFIDCTSHTVQHLPTMPVHMHYTVADVSCGRIYVFGFLGTDPDRSYAMLVFDTETQTWEGPMTVPGMQIGYGCLVVMAGKMYMRGFQNIFVYNPKKSKWETDEVLSLKLWQYPCVVDDVLYFYDYSDKELCAYDPEHKCWQVVKGVEDFLTETRRAGCVGCDHALIAGRFDLLDISLDVVL